MSWDQLYQKALPALLVVGLGWIWTIDDRVQNNANGVAAALDKAGDNRKTGVEQRNSIREESREQRMNIRAEHDALVTLADRRIDDLNKRLSHAEGHLETAKMCTLEHLP